MKTKFKRNIITLMATFAILMSVLGPSLVVLADSDDANAEFNKQVGEYVGDSEEFTDVIELIQNDEKESREPAKNTMAHVMKRLFAPGEYINDVEYGVLGSGLGVKKGDILVNDRYACNPKAPNNLINHNCNIPNFTTGLAQNVVYPFMTPFNNAGKTSSYSTFGFGVPANIPGGKVPTNPGNREHTYTALELYGYDLKLTSYNGEWDRITVSNEARMLSNFGVIDTITLMGTGLWNSIKAGSSQLVSGMIENFSFNPIRWISSISDVFESALSGGLNTVIDSSDLNIVATNAWKRESFSNTLYNVYVLTDKEVLHETSKRYFREFIKQLQDKSEVSPELLLVLELEAIPGFEFIADWETDESIAAREAAEATNASESARASADPEYSPSYVTVPEPVYYTEKEQLGFWAKDNQAHIDKAASKGLISSNPDDYETYEEIVKNWEAAWDLYSAQEFDAHGDVITKIAEESDKDVFIENPHLDPKQPISHYACATETGSIMRDGSGNIEYLYLKNNVGNQEFLNPKCGKARSPIGGGLFGSGWHTKVEPDTRHKDNINNDFFGIFHKLNNGLTSVNRSISSFMAKLTNVILGLSFSPILSELGIDVIVAELVEGFKNTIFFPMSALVASLGALMLFFQIFKNGSAWHLLASVFVTVLIFIAGTVFLITPDATVRLVDDVPSKIDNFLADAVLVDDDGTSYCSTGTEKDGIRSAQCNVWGAMVFNPWVHLQFGTGYDNLYAKGFAPPGGSEMKNKNESLVGDAAVYMGGGQTVNNWALYQLDKTKAGTINNFDFSNIQAIGTVDKDMYRIVDLQAGPKDGLDSDSRYFKDWAGLSGNTLIRILSFIQTIIMFVAIAGLGISKIEASFMFAISIIFLPFMLLYALLPQGKIKLKNYISNLISLLIRRAIVTVMLAVLLKVLSLSYSRVDSIIEGSILAIAISVAFILYKKEMLNSLAVSESGGIMGGDTTEVKKIISENVPRSVKQRYQMTAAKVKGAGSGFAGGIAGTRLYRKDLKKDGKETKKKLQELLDKEQDEVLTSEERKMKDDLSIELAKIEEKKSEGKSALKEGVKGARNTEQLIGRRTERSIRKEGFAADKIYSGAKSEVINDGANRITEKDDPTALDTYKEVLSHSESNKSKTSEKRLSKEEGRLLQSPKIQKEIRRLAKERDKLAKENENNKNYTALSPDKRELEELAKVIDKRRNAQRFKGAILHPVHEKEIRDETLARKDSRKVTTNVEDIKDQLTKEKADDEAKRVENARREAERKSKLIEEMKLKEERNRNNKSKKDRGEQ